MLERFLNKEPFTLLKQDTTQYVLYTKIRHLIKKKMTTNFTETMTPLRKKHAGDPLMVDLCNLASLKVSV